MSPQMNNDTGKYWETLRKELLYIIEHDLSPIASEYGYTDVPLESKIKWRPLVLLLGNYSSGKSTFINEFIGMDVQQTGQAPTDDSFTVITGGEAEESEVQERDGRNLLYDQCYPFHELRRHGESFASHFRLKVVPTPALANLAVVDTPGMLDSIAEKDRGYDYQAVIGDLAQVADLIVVFFDPHKAGTIKESYASLRYTLPEKTYEDRVVFVLNRVDECSSLSDLLKVYGTLCWNLSQMTGRKDIPQILLTHSPSKLVAGNDERRAHLELLANQRQRLQDLISAAPKHRLDHLATFLEYHARQLAMLLEVLGNYGRRRRGFILKFSFLGLMASFMATFVVASYIYFVEPGGPIADSVILGMGAVAIALLYAANQLILFKVAARIFHRRLVTDLDDLVDARNQLEEEHWAKLRPLVTKLLERPEQLPPLKKTRRSLDKLSTIYKKTVGEIRSAINQLHQAGIES